MWRFPEHLRRWMWRRLPAEARLRLGQSRIYLLPTRFGLALLLVALAVWLGALNYQVSLAYALAFWIVGLELIAVLLAYRQLAGLQLSARAGPPVFAGEAARFAVLLDNAGHGQARQLSLSLWLAPGAAQGCELAAGGQAALWLECPAERRGWVDAPACQLWSEVPFGLVRAFAVLKLSAQVLAYPTPLPDGAREGGQAGEAEPGGTLRPGGEEFSHLDAYLPGDAPRQIAWKALAQRDALVSKRFAAEASQAQRVLDWRDYGAGQDAELRLSRLAWRVERCERQREPYRLRLPGVEIAPQAGQREAALRALALFREGA